MVTIVHRHVFVFTLLILILDLFFLCFFIDLVSCKLALDHLCLVIVNELSIGVIHLLILLLLRLVDFLFLVLSHLRLFNLLLIFVLFLLLTLLLLLFLSLFLFLSLLQLFG